MTLAAGRPFSQLLRYFGIGPVQTMHSTVPLCRDLQALALTTA